MAKNVRYVVMFVRSRGCEQSHVLGELGAVYNPFFTLGRDAGLPIRFGPRGLGITLDQIPVDDRQAEANRIANSLRDPLTHVSQLDDKARAWCAEQIYTHFSALSGVTTPLRPLSPVITSSGVTMATSTRAGCSWPTGTS
jgi:hypothetical protein